MTKQKQPVIAVIGGGFGGLACLIELRRFAPDAKSHLIDTNLHFVEKTRLHETLHRSIDHYRVPFFRLAEHHGFKFHHAKVDLSQFSSDQKQAFTDAQSLLLTSIDCPDESQTLSFDYLVVATGSSTKPIIAPQPKLHTLGSLFQHQGRDLLSDFFASTSAANPEVAIVGAGATGVQFAFALADAAKDRSRPLQITLIDQAARPMPTLPEACSDYVLRQMRTNGMHYLAKHTVLDFDGDQLSLHDIDNDQPKQLPVDWAWVFTGIKAQPLVLNTNDCGQVLNGTQVIKQIYACGDCAIYEHMTAGQQTAQAATQQGKHIAWNISQQISSAPVTPFEVNQRGYLVSLGRCDGCGWVKSESNVVNGWPAAALKKTIEARDRLY
ncbi:MAG: FAD-dependent oxidoreductase, partial [Gammaproteobacteria bacterium]|nr:FAD-dependent oxidoreductase [Gammaproteobacteria bacterium]